MDERITRFKDAYPNKEFITVPDGYVAIDFRPVKLGDIFVSNGLQRALTCDRKYVACIGCWRVILKPHAKSKAYIYRWDGSTTKKVEIPITNTNTSWFDALPERVERAAK